MSTEIILVTISNGDQVLYLNKVLIASEEANDTNSSVNLADLGKTIAEALGASLQIIKMEVPKDPEWTFSDIYELLPASPQTEVVYRGYLKLPLAEQIDVDFAAPSGASKAMAYAEKLEKFVDGIRRLYIWAWTTDSGEDYNECDKPAKGYEDSHSALMNLIEAARDLGTEPKTEFTAAEPMVEIPTAIIEINGGVVNSVTTSHLVRIVILDADTEGAQEDDVCNVDGTDYYVQDHQGHASRCNTEYVKGVLQQID